MAVTEHVCAPRTLFSRSTRITRADRTSWRRPACYRLADDAIVVRQGEAELATLSAREDADHLRWAGSHMVENAMAAIGAASEPGSLLTSSRAGWRPFQRLGDIIPAG